MPRIDVAVFDQQNRVMRLLEEYYRVQLDHAEADGRLADWSGLEVDFTVIMERRPRIHVAASGFSTHALATAGRDDVIRTILAHWDVRVIDRLVVEVGARWAVEVHFEFG